MADVKWIKIVTDIFDDEKVLLIETLPEADSIIVIWFKLLCLAGKQNNSGVFMLNDKMPYNEKMFATIFRRKETTIQLALQTFENFGMIEIINDTVTIPNWGKHQTLDQIENKNEYMKNYMREYRDKQKRLIECKSNSKTNSKANVRQAELDKKEIKKKENEKDIYGAYKNVTLSKDEMQKLIDKHGEYKTNELIEFLSAYREDKGYKNKSDYLAIGRWVVDAVEKKDKKSDNPFKDRLRKEIEREADTERNHIDDGDDPYRLSRILPEPK